MISDFFKKNIEPMLISDNKTFNDQECDFYKLYYVINKDRECNMTPDLKEIYTTYIDDDIFNYKITDEERNFIIDVFKSHIENRTKHSIICSSILGSYFDDEIKIFLFEQLKKNINKDIFLSVNLLNECTLFSDYIGVDFFVFLKKQLNNNYLPKEFKKYIQDIIDFEEGKSDSLDSPSVHIEPDGNNIKIYWY